VKARIARGDESEAPASIWRGSRLDSRRVYSHLAVLKISGKRLFHVDDGASHEIWGFRGHKRHRTCDLLGNGEAPDGALRVDSDPTHGAQLGSERLLRRLPVAMVGDDPRALVRYSS